MMIVVIALSRSYRCQPMHVRRAVGVGTPTESMPHGIDRAREQYVGNYMEPES